MAQPPFPAPDRIEILGVLPGEFGSGDGGWLSTLDGSASVRIDGNPSEAFSIVGLETFALRVSHDPDLPPGPHPVSWQTVASVDGPGPIAVRKNEALVITVGFACPTGTTQKAFDASVVVSGNALQAASLPVDAQAASTVGLKVGYFADPNSRAVTFTEPTIQSRSTETGTGSDRLQFVALGVVSDGTTRYLDDATVTFKSSGPPSADGYRWLGRAGLLPGEPPSPWYPRSLASEGQLYMNS